MFNQPRLAGLLRKGVRREQHCLPQVLRGPLVLLDAAKACQTTPPDLSRTPVHFLSLSFYKVFGYPTGLGALVVRKDAARHLRPPFLGGGTIAHALAATWPSATAPGPFPAAFESGTSHFHGISALPAGFAAWRKHTHDRRGAQRACALAARLARKLAALRHANGQPACAVLGWPRQCGYGAMRTAAAKNATCTNKQSPETLEKPAECSWSLGIGEDVAPEDTPGSRAQDFTHGPVVAFVVWDAQGCPLSSHSVRDTLAASHVFVRSGCCCNPGACAAVLGLTDSDVLRNVQEGWTCGGDVGVVGGRHTGVVRASLGVMSGLEDIDALLTALQQSVCGVHDSEGGSGHSASAGSSSQGHDWRQGQTSDTAAQLGYACGVSAACTSSAQCSSGTSRAKGTRTGAMFCVGTS